MAATATPTAEVERGWLATLFGQPAMPARALRRRSAPGAGLAADAAAALLALDRLEERARAATSGFEMGEYEPLARRN